MNKKVILLAGHGRREAGAGREMPCPGWILRPVKKASPARSSPGRETSENHTFCPSLSLDFFSRSSIVSAISG